MNFVTRDMDVLSVEIKKIYVTLSTLSREYVLPVLIVNSKLYYLNLFVRYFELYLFNCIF